MTQILPYFQFQTEFLKNSSVLKMKQNWPGCAGQFYLYKIFFVLFLYLFVTAYADSVNKYPEMLNDVDDSNANGLHLASWKGYLEPVVFLVEHMKMDPKIKGK